MTLFTSVQRSDLETAFIYLVISTAVAVFGGIYEYFSFGVWSYFMVYAFMIPLAGGALPFMIRHFRNKRADHSGMYDASGKKSMASSKAETINGRMLYHAAMATLTTGSIIKGVLDIYGTTNRLLIGYAAAAAILIIAAAIHSAIEARRPDNRRPGTSRTSTEVLP